MLALSKDISIYAVGNFAQRAVTFFLVPMYTAVLAISEYGLIETIVVTSQVIIFLMDVGMSRSILRYYSRYQNNPKQLDKMISTGLIVMCISSFLILGIGILFRDSLSQLLFGDQKYSSLLIWTLIASFLNVFLLLVLILFRAQRQSGRYVVVSLIYLFALTSLTIYFVRYLNFGVLGMLYAQCVVNLTLSVIFLPRALNLHLRNIGFSRNLARQLFKFGFPLIFAMAGMLTMNSVDRYFLVHFRSLEDVGIYSLGVRIAAILGIFVVTPFQLAWGPYMFDKEDEDLSNFASRVFTYLIFILALGGTIVLLFSKEIILLLSSPSYLDSQEVIPFMLISVALMGIYYWAGGLVNLVEKTWRLGLIVFFAGICNIVLNFLLTPTYGWIGASWAVVIARAVAVGLTFSVAIKFYRIPFEYKRIIFILLFLFGLCSSYYFILYSITGVFGFSLRILVILASLMLLVFPFRFFTNKEWKFLHGKVMALRIRDQ